MAVTFVGATAGNSGSATATTQVTSFPGGWQQDDVAILFTGFGGNSIAVNSGTTGWTAITGFSNPQTQSTSSRGYAYRRVLQSGDTAPTIGYDGNITGGWAMIVVRGANTTTPVGQADDSNTSGTSVNIASLTGILAGSMLVTLMHARVPSGTAVPAQFTPDADYTQPAGVVTATTRNTGTSQNVRLGGGYRAISSAGNYGGDTFSTDQTSSIISLHVEVLSAASTVTGAAVGSVSISGAASGVRTVLGAGAGAVAVTGSATGTRSTPGAAAGTLAITGTATGARKVTGAGAGSLAVAGTAAGIRKVLGAAVGTVTVAGAASGMVPSGNVTGSGLGVVTVTGTASGVRATHGSAAGSVAVSGSATAVRRVLGAATGTLALAGSSTGRRMVLSAAVGAVALAGTAVGRRTTFGSAAGALVLVGTAAGDVPDSVIERPNTGTTSRPSTGVITRPNTGLVSRP